MVRRGRHPTLSFDPHQLWLAQAEYSLTVQFCFFQQKNGASGTAPYGYIMLGGLGTTVATPMGQHHFVEAGWRGQARTVRWLVIAHVDGG